MTTGAVAAPPLAVGVANDRAEPITVVTMAANLVGISDAIKGWQVSERTLRRRLSTGIVPNAQRDDQGSWLLPTSWLDTEFDRNDIDLTEQSVADGLAEALAKIGSLTDRTVTAETAAAIADHERDDAINRVRSLASDLEHESAERQRLQQDVVTLEKEIAVEFEKRTAAEQHLDETRQRLKELGVETGDRIKEMTARLEEQQGRLSMLQAMIGRRQKRKYDRLVDEMRFRS